MLNKIPLKRIEIFSIILITILYAFMIAISWQKWGTLIIDCGRDPYVAESLLAGKSLYTGIYYVYGPLVPYLFALLFLIFGINLNICYLTGIIVAYIILITLYFLAKNIISNTYSIIATLTVLFLLCFNSTLFNYIFPYTYSALFGLLFTVLFACFILIYLNNEKSGFLYAAGVVSGLAFITKIEFGTGLFLSLIVFIIMARNSLVNINKKTIAITLLPAVMIPVISLIILIVLSGWNNFIEFFNYFLLSLNSTASRFLIERSFGLNNLPNLVMSLVDPLILPLIVLFILSIIAFVIFKHKPDRAKSMLWITIPFTLTLYLLISVTIYPGAIYTLYIFISRIAAFFPMLMLAVIVYYLYKTFVNKVRLNKEQLFVFLLALISILISLRFLFLLMIFGYGTYYAPLMFLVLFYLLSKLDSGNPETLPLFVTIKYYCISLIIIVVFYMTAYYVDSYNKRVVEISTEKGTIKAEKSPGMQLQILTKYIKNATVPGEKIALFPEESGIYFLSDRKSATKFYDYMPVRLFSRKLENSVIHALKTKNINFIAVSNHAASDYNSGYWGVDYNRLLYLWIEKNYKFCGSIGYYGFTAGGDNYTLRIYRKSCKNTPKVSSGALNAK